MRYWELEKLNLILSTVMAAVMLYESSWELL